MTRRRFLLSPARADGERARLLLAEEARSPLAERLRDGRATIGEVFAFCSALYFRGKLAYARRFATAPDAAGVLVITPAAGLVPADATIDRELLRALGAVDVRAGNGAYERPLRQTLRRLARALGEGEEVVLLGSIASDKYVAALLEELGDRLRYPPDFVGRGDMSRGGLLLRAARSGIELPYAPLDEAAVRHGARPPRLPRLARR